MISIDELATALLLSDSGFPSGAFTSSWGLEGLVVDGIVSDAPGVCEFVEAQIVHRWATCDRWFVGHAYTAHNDIT